MKAFVTGSTGLLGSNLVNLLLTQGFEVKALARSEQKARQVLGKNTRAQIVVGDMENVGDFASELAGSDILFHAAAYFREYYAPGDHWAQLKKINIDATIRLLDEAEKQGVKKTIYVSSATVLGGSKAGIVADELTPPDPDFEENLYRKSKVLAERAINEWLKTHHMPVVYVLPSVMIGPQDAAPTAVGQIVVNLLSQKIPAMPPGGFEFVDARDVAQAMIKAVECGKSGERYVTSQGYHTIEAMSQIIESLSGVPAPRLHPPYPMLLLVALIGERIATLRGTTANVSVNGLRLLRHKHNVTARKAVRELGVTFRAFEDSLRDEVVWYQTNGYIKASQ